MAKSARPSEKKKPAKKPGGGTSSSHSGKAHAKPVSKATARAAAPAPKAKTMVPAKPAPKAPAAKAPANTKPAAGAKAPAAKPAPAAKTAAPAKGTEATKAAAAATPAAAAVGGDKKKGPKGITIVTPKPVKVTKPKVKFQLPVSEPLMKPGGKWKPLIPSGPGAPARVTLEMAAGDGGKKPRLPKRDLDRYRQILLRKRAELVGDVAHMEDEALRQSGSGSLSHTPQHMAEQGTDVFDQSLSLDLAQVDRNLIREIDDALQRIESGTYGFCELTGKPISPDRLEELPWTRFSIEAARARERRPFQG